MFVDGVKCGSFNASGIETATHGDVSCSTPSWSSLILLKFKCPDSVDDFRFTEVEVYESNFKMK